MLAHLHSVRRGASLTNGPDFLGILYHTTIRGEEPCSRSTEDTFGEPVILVLVCLVNQILGVTIALEIIRDKIEVAVVNNAINKRRELVGITKTVTLNGIKHLAKIVVELEFAVVVSMAQIFNVFRQVTEEEDILLADFSCNLVC